MSEPALDLELTLRHMDEARQVIPRGVTSAKRVREPTPLVFERAEGSRMFDVDGNEYIDYLAGFGPLLLGHRPEFVFAAVERALEKGLLFGGQHAGELELARRLVEMVPSAEMALLCASGSEATHLAVRLARAATGRSQVIKCEGHYHGWLEPLAMNQPGTPPGTGYPRPVLEPAGQTAPDYVHVCEWNDMPGLVELLDRLGEDAACIIMEPIPFNGGVFRIDSAYLGAVREECDRRGIALIFDEVITGFRLAPGGAQERIGVIPDLTVLGKAMGAGFPIAAVVGSERMMGAAAGEVQHAGTYNGGLPAVAAANAALGFLASAEGAAAYAELERRSAHLASGLRCLVGTHDLPILVDRVGSVLRLSWGLSETPRSYAEARRSDAGEVAALACDLLGYGVHIQPRGAFYVSMAHSDADVEQTLAAADRLFAVRALA